jgi:hypothetical protein
MLRNAASASAGKTNKFRWDTNLMCLVDADTDNPVELDKDQEGCDAVPELTEFSVFIQPRLRDKACLPA